MKTSTRVLPNLFVIGAAKSGTTSLHSYLDAHPEISMSQPKEPAVFATAEWRDQLHSYGEMFSSPEATIKGESSTRYTCFPVVQGIPERVASTCPDARFVYVVREPIDRVVANWVEAYASMREHATLARALMDLDQPGNRYVAGSRYATQLEQWLEHFGRERFLVIDQVDLRRHRAPTLLEVLRFLEVSPEVPADTETELNATEAKETMTPSAARLWFTLSPVTRRLPPGVARYLSSSRLFPVEKVGAPALGDALRARLADELRGEASRFRDLTGMRFASWSI